MDYKQIQALREQNTKLFKELMEYKEANNTQDYQLEYYREAFRFLRGQQKFEELFYHPLNRHMKAYEKKREG